MLVPHLDRLTGLWEAELMGLSSASLPWDQAPSDKCPSYTYTSLQSLPPASGPWHSGLASFPQQRAISPCTFWLPRHGGGARHGDLGGRPGLHEPDTSFLWHRAPHISTCLEPPHLPEDLPSLVLGTPRSGCRARGKMASPIISGSALTC